MRHVKKRQRTENQEEKLDFLEINYCMNTEPTTQNFHYIIRRLRKNMKILFRERGGGQSASLQDVEDAAGSNRGGDNDGSSDGSSDDNEDSDMLEV